MLLLRAVGARVPEGDEMRKFLGSVILTTALVAGLAACGDDSDRDQATVPKLDGAAVKYCGELKAVGETFTDPGIDKIFEECPGCSSRCRSPPSP